MKFKSLILLAISLLILCSCDDALKFENPLDEHNQSNEPKETGTLGGECYGNKTCNEGLTCNKVTNICEKAADVSDSGNTAPDSGDTAPDSGYTGPDSGDTGPDSGDTEPPAACKLDAAYATSDAEAYFAFKGIGEINSMNVQDPSWVNLVTVELVGVEGKDLDYADSYSFFMQTTFQDMPAVKLQAMGDPDMSLGRFTAVGLAIVPIEYIDYMKETGTYYLDQAPIVQIFDLSFSADDAYYKQCQIAANKVDESSWIALGRMQICYDKNKEFAAGETFKLSMAAELAVGEDILKFYDAESLEDLCVCYEINSGEEIDCSVMNPCRYGDPCIGVANSTGMCIETGNTTYTCECIAGSEWNGTECAVDPSNPPECSPAGATPCYDPSTGLTWSAKTSDTMDFYSAVSYCDGLYENGLDGWHLPNIDELKTLLIADRITENCQVSEVNNCLSNSSCWTCETCTQAATPDCSDFGISYSDGRYSKLGDTGYLWSSSLDADYSDPDFDSYTIWFVDFDLGLLSGTGPYNYYNPVRCVR